MYEHGVLLLMSARRLDDRIRELCATAVEARNPEKVRHTLSELRGAIHEYTHRLRQRAFVFVDAPHTLRERRKV